MSKNQWVSLGLFHPSYGGCNLNLQLVGVHLVVTVVEFEIFEFLSHHFGHDICTQRGLEICFVCLPKTVAAMTSGISTKSGQWSFPS